MTDRETDSGLQCVGLFAQQNEKLEKTIEVNSKDCWQIMDPCGQFTVTIISSADEPLAKTDALWWCRM